MKRRILLAASALGLAACSSTTAPHASAMLAASQQSMLRFGASCASVWDISVDGRDSGPMLFMSTSEHYDAPMGSGGHQWSATRWAPSGVATEQGTAADGGAVVLLRCS